MEYDVFGSCTLLKSKIGKIKSKTTRREEAAVTTDKTSVSEIEWKREDSALLHLTGG